jgi:hypothetical protein
MTFALAALALPLALHAAPAEHGRHVRAAADCAAALRLVLPNARITAAVADPSNDSLRALGQKPYCRVEATVDSETHIVAACWGGHNQERLVPPGVAVATRQLHALVRLQPRAPAALGRVTKDPVQQWLTRRGLPGWSP